MRRTMRGKLVAVLAAAGLALTACGGGADGGASGGGGDTPAADYDKLAREDVRDGGELRLPLSELSEQQNPFQADGTLYTSTIWEWYNPQLSLFTPEGEWSYNPDYFTDVRDEVKDGKTVVTYDIREEATFNDGTPIDWTAFENTWKLNNGEDPDANPSSTDGYVLIESVKKGDGDKQAVVTYSQPYPWWKGLFNYLVPPQVDTGTKFNEEYLKQLHPEWGAGPYTVESVDFKAGQVTFTRNDKWWGDPGKLDKVSYRYMEDSASLNAFQNGEIDATGVATKERYERVKDMDGIDVRTGRQPSNYLLTLNATTPVLKDERVREAIMTAIDRTQIAAVRFNGLNYSEEAPGSFNMLSAQDGYEDNFGEVVQYDPEKAASLLDEAGWTMGADGIREKNGEKLSVRYTNLGDDSTIKALALAYQKMLKDIGIDVRIVERPTSDFSAVITKRDFDLFPMGFTMGAPYGVAYFDQVYNSQSQLNRSGTGSEELDAKIRDLSRIADGREQITKANELEKEALRHFGIMPVFNGPEIIAMKEGLANFGPMLFGVIPKEDIGWAA